MKMILFLLLAAVSSQGSADNKAVVYTAYITQRLDDWKNVIDRMEATNPRSNEFLLELINYQYGYIGYCLGYNKEEDARKYLMKAEKNLAELEKAGYRLPEVHGYHSAFHAYRAALNRITAPINGQKSINHARKSVELDNNNYHGFIQLGNAYFYMPKSVGGSKKTALENFKKARMLMEKDPSLIKENWNYIRLLMMIAQSYSYLGEFDKSKAEYENILKLEPRFIKVRNELYPNLLKEMKN